MSLVLRPYQREAISSIQAELTEGGSTLLVMATGLGKSLVGAHIIHSFQQQSSATRWDGRQLWLTHREELLQQAAGTIAQVTGESPDIEKAERWADQASWQGWRARCIVSSVQTQNSGRNGHGRMSRFAPNEFNLLTVDECHHSTASSYIKVLDHYQRNKDLKMLGLTATPNRFDEAALGQVFGSCAFNYGIHEGVRDGWLVEPKSFLVHIHDLDLSQCRTTAGDLNGADLARQLELEKPLHGMADATYRLAEGRKTLMFCASVAQAERVAEILNRHKSACARFVCGKTPDQERRKIFLDYKYGNFQFLVNVGITTEGWDEPSVAVISMCRPTKSLPFFTQMIGRGTRPLPGTVDFDNEVPDEQLRLNGRAAELRRAAIAASGKPELTIIDFTGNSGRHKLVTVVDALGGRYADDVVERAKQDGEMQEDCRTADERLAEAQAKIEAERQVERERRSTLIGRAVFTTTPVNPFDVLGCAPPRIMGWDKIVPPTERQIAMMQRWGLPVTPKMSKGEASNLIDAWLTRQTKGLATYKQVKALRKSGIDGTNLSFALASKLLDRISANGWRPISRMLAAQIINKGAMEESGVPF